MTAAATIAYFASLKGLTRKAAKQRAYELLERYGLGEFADAAWVAADRAISAAELAGDRLDVIAGHFRLAHAFIRLRRYEQAEHVDAFLG